MTTISEELIGLQKEKYIKNREKFHPKAVKIFNTIVHKLKESAKHNKNSCTIVYSFEDFKYSGIYFVLENEILKDEFESICNANGIEFIINGNFEYHRNTFWNPQDFHNVNFTFKW